MPTQREVEIKTANKDGGEPFKAKVKYNFPATISEAFQMYNPPNFEEGSDSDLVYEMFNRSLTIAVQAVGRKLLTEDPAANPGIVEEIQRAVDGWKPGMKATRVRTIKVADPVKQAMEQLETMSDEEADAMMARMQEKYNLRKQQLSQQINTAGNGTSEAPTSSYQLGNVTEEAPVITPQDVLPEPEPAPVEASVETPVETPVEVPAEESPDESGRSRRGRR